MSPTAVVDAAGARLDAAELRGDVPGAFAAARALLDALLAETDA